MVDKFHKYFIPTRYWEEETLFRKAKIFVNTVLLTTLFALFYIGNTVMFEMPHMMVQISLYTVLFFSLVWLFKYGIRLSLLANVFSFLFFTSCTYDVYYTGGLYSATFAWYAMVPVIAMLISNLRTAMVWMVLCLITMTIIGVLQMNDIQFPVDVNPEFLMLLMLSSMLGLVAIVFAVASVMENAYLDSLRKLDDKNKLIKQEKKRSDDLLLNILPYEVAEELKTKGHADAKLIDQATVMFTDFKGFTEMSESLEAQELVGEINYCFCAFDRIMERHSVEKIKTIGDAYMAVGGIQSTNPNKPKHVINAALDIQEFVRNRVKEKKAKGEPHFDIRIGIHTGPVVAGIVGIKKFQYDIWGDTVNTANRMESSSEVGKINISNSTYELVKDSYNCEYRGEIEAKGKGIMKMYFVSSRS